MPIFPGFEDSSLKCQRSDSAFLRTMVGRLLRDVPSEVWFERRSDQETTELCNWVAASHMGKKGDKPVCLRLWEGDLGRANLMW